ncbi:MAG TPA: hypothetical protein VMD59_13930, partial [Acidimicrobiales bacterium]|nr:hypothetical protein [Acidimicrobiales bacterium]
VRVASGELVVRLAPDEWLAIGAPGSAPAIAARWAGDPASGAEAPAGAEAPPGSEAPSGAAPADAADAAPTGAAAVHGAAAGIGGGAGGGLGRAPLVSAVDVTHQHVLLRVTGEQAALLLQKLCAVDLGDRAAPDGTAFRSSLARVHTAVVRDDRAGERSYLLASDRSSGQYLLGVLLDAGEELGAGVTGYRAGVAGA